MLMIIISIVIVLLLGAGIYYYLNSCNFAKECSYECFSKLLTNQLKEKNLLIAYNSIDVNKVPDAFKNSDIPIKENVRNYRNFVNEFVNITKGGAAESDYNQDSSNPAYVNSKTCSSRMAIYGAAIIRNVANAINIYK